MAQQQVIGGKSYTMYTPEWYAARDANQVHDASVAGTASGTAQGAESRTIWEAAHPGQQYGTNFNAPDPLARPSLQGFPETGRSGGGGGAGGGGGSMVPNLTTPATKSALSDLVALSRAPYGTVAPGEDPGAPTIQHASIDSGVEGAARAATFARTRDNAAKTASASLTGLQEALAGRGLQGGGYEAGQVGTTLAREANTIGEGDRQQAESELARSADVADKTYEGQIVQRQQDLTAAASRRSLAMEQAQLAVQQRQTSLAGLEAALAGSKGVY